jgi:diacylglycerol kinase family enzyme
VSAVRLEALERAAARDAGGAKARRMLVIANPYASTMSARLKHLVVYALQGRYDVEAVDTQRKGHAIELCREAANEGYDVVCAFGGDGTVNEVANGLAGSSTPMTCLPGGATNVYCRMLGIPNDVVDATEHLLRVADDWTPRPVDLGKVNGRWFTFSAGAGLDASIVEVVDRHSHLKARYGPYFFTAAGLSVFLRRYVRNPPRVVVETADGTTMTGVSAFVQNSTPYTFFKKRPVEVVGGATLESGTMTVGVLERASAVDAPTIITRGLAPRLRIEDHRRVGTLRDVTEVTVRSADEREVPVQVDGDFVGVTEQACFKVVPGALHVVA